jgi:hypothetical protein
MSHADVKTVRMREWHESLATSQGSEDKLREVLKSKVPKSRDGAATLLADLTTLEFVNPVQVPVRVDLAKIAEILAVAIQKLPANSSNKMFAEADIHASVNLHQHLISIGLGRQLAGDSGMWAWLNLSVPDWSLARWKGSADRDAGYEPWFGNPSSNALGRLFWAAELMRNGSDYSPVHGAFLQQNVINELAREIYRSRHWAVALGSLAADFDGSGSHATDREWNVVSKVADKIAFLNRPEAAPLDEEVPDFGDDDPVVAYAADPIGIASVQQLLGKYLAGIAVTERIRSNKVYCPDGSR